MKKIYVLILAAAAFVVSCSSPYYPEYVPIIALGISADDVVCESEEGNCSVSVISNVEYDATIVSGQEWLSFADTDALTRKGNGNSVLNFKYFQNNNDKRVAHVVVSSVSRADTVKIKQKSCYVDELVIHETSKELFTLEKGTRMEVAWEGGDYSFRVRTGALSHQLKAWTPNPNVITKFHIENNVVTLTVAQNNELQPRIVNFQVSYVDGWEEEKALKLSINQLYNPDLMD